MSNRTIHRRAFLGTVAAFPAGVLAQPQTANPSGVGVRVAAGESRLGRPLKLPDGSPLFIKVATQDSGGAFFLTEQPSGAKGGPPKHFHLEEDEWFYCLAGEYIVEVGNQRHELKAGDSVLGPRRVPHAFAFVGNTPGRLMVGFTPAGRVEQFFRDLAARKSTSSMARWTSHAVGIETAMHERLAEARINIVNRRREFFRATPSEVKAHLGQLAGELLQFHDVPEALEYRQCLARTLAPAEQLGPPGDSPAR